MYEACRSIFESNHKSKKMVTTWKKCDWYAIGLKKKDFMQNFNQIFDHEIQIFCNFINIWSWNIWSWNSNHEIFDHEIFDHEIQKIWFTFVDLNLPL